MAEENKKELMLLLLLVEMGAEGESHVAAASS